jgi:hypothetical protein
MTPGCHFARHLRVTLKFNQADDGKAKTGEVHLAGMVGLPTNSQKAEFTYSK